MKTIQRIKNNKSWKESLKELRTEYRTTSRPCLSMSKDKFNELMVEYRTIKPLWSYQKRKKYLQYIIDQNEERNIITRNTIHSKLDFTQSIGYQCGSHHALEWLDGKLDETLDLMGPIDLS